MVGYDVDDAEAVDGLQVICQVGKLHMKAIPSLILPFGVMSGADCR